MKRISTSLACLSLLFAALALAAPIPASAPAAPAAPAPTVAPATAPAVFATPAQPPAPLWLADGKCATCPELLKACKDFCGSNNVTFNCQNHNPCAGTCSCTV
jgi:hypothetical protein